MKGRATRGREGTGEEEAGKHGEKHGGASEGEAEGEAQRVAEGR